MDLLFKFRRSLFIVAMAIIFSSCSTTTVKTMSASDAMSLKAEPMKVWSRPLETGFKVVGMGEGKATSNDIEKAIGDAPNFFLAGSVPVSSLSPVAKLAAFNVVRKEGADGMYITMVKEEHSSYTEGGQLTKREATKAWVRGILLKLVFYETVSPERSDAARNCEKGCPGSFIVTPNNKAKE